MSQTLIADCTDRNCSRCAAPEHGTRHSVARTAELPSSATLLNALRDTAKPMRNRYDMPERADLNGVRARYDIEAESAWLTLFLAGVSVGCVIAVGIMKMLRAR